MLWASASSGLRRIASRHAAMASSSFPWSFRVIAEAIVGQGEVGLEPDRLAERGDGLVELPLVLQGDAEVIVGLGEVGLEPDRLAAFGDGLVDLPLVARVTPRVLWGLARSGLSRISLATYGDGLFECLGGFLRPTTFFQLRPQAANVTAHLGPESGQVPEHLDRLVGLALVASAWASSWAVSGRIERAAV